MLSNAMGVTGDRSTKVGHYVATLAVVASAVVFSYSVGCLKLLSCKKIHYEQGCR